MGFMKHVGGIAGDAVAMLANGVLSLTNHQISAKLRQIVSKQLGCPVDLEVNDLNISLPDKNARISINADAKLERDKLLALLCEKVKWNAEDIRLDALNIHLNEDGMANVHLDGNIFIGLKGEVQIDPVELATMLCDKQGYPIEEFRFRAVDVHLKDDGMLQAHLDADVEMKRTEMMKLVKN